MNTKEFILTIIIQLMISFVSVIILYNILSGHIVISILIGVFIGAIYHERYEAYTVKRDYNNGICPTCGNKYTVETRWHLDSMAEFGYDIDMAICNTCKIAVRIPGIMNK